LMQDVWRLGFGWDDELTGDVLLKWKKWLGELNNLPNIKIPRCYSYQMKSCSRRELHIFCDASEKAFAAVAYIVCFTPAGIDVSLIFAKSRVAPLKPISIPRLELQAAVMGCRMAETIKENHNIEFHDTYYWTDSCTVLCWLKSKTRQFKQFVAYRVGEILEKSNATSWLWVPTSENPADEATRDTSPPALGCHSRWLNGPAFIREEKSLWPTQKSKLAPSNEELEIKAEYILKSTEVTYDALPDPNRFSSFNKLIRTTAWILRFVKKCRKSKQQGSLSVDELAEAKTLWILRTQDDCYPTEIRDLKAGNNVKKNSSIYSLSPMLDDHDVMRVDGRLTKSTELKTETKYPIILDSHHQFTRLLMHHFHIQANHNGMETVANNIRQKWWIPQLRIALRGIWNRCQYCKIRRSSPVHPKMGDLPAARVNHVKPFSSVGLDYFGPIAVKNCGKLEKRYGVIFTCFSTRAIHLEVAKTLTTESCILAIRRMISRRGFPSEICSDNATNFRGATEELKNCLRTLDHNKIQEVFAEKEINWKFIPPGCPHMGGVWERLIRSVKTSLKVVLGNNTPTDEMLSTVLTEAEALVNSRPLTFVSLDPADEEALTPNHFLLGVSSPTLVPVNNQNKTLVSTRNWRTTQTLIDHFWKRWVKEYLPTLTRRSKWLEPQNTIEVGSLVVIADSKMPRGCWPKGRIVNTYPGSDGIIRVVDVQTQFGIFRRPVSKICILDLNTESDGPKDPPRRGE